MADRPDSDREVLTSLPRSRPARRSDKRARRPAPDRPAGGAPAAAATPRASAPPKAAPKAASRRPRTAPRRSIPPAGYAAPPPDAHDGPPRPPDLVGTAVQAAGELARIGFAVGRQTLRSVLDRLPRP
ncbi:MAG TPA: hypothetical protein VM299_03430 [Solirubrobacteraceae bacterium]|jgi:hypothetical protein|nr:hypothetical protein [Solirubrobacteraceae bacterium]